MVSVDRIQGLSGSLAVKAPCRVATTAAITLAGEQTIDGVAVVTGDRVLVKDQGTTSTNGIYDVSTAGWTRSLDFNGINDAVNGTLILVAAGTVSAGLVFRVVGTNPIVPGTSAITFTVAATFTALSVLMAALLDDTTEAQAQATLGVDFLSAAQGGAISNMGASDPFSQCHLVPFKGNRLLINGAVETIPPGSLSVSGGVIATYSSCYVNKVAAQSLAANTEYYIYAWMNAGVMTLNFHAGNPGNQPVIDSTYGIYVHPTDSAQTLVGFLRTNAAVKTLGNAKGQTIISYYNRLRYRLDANPAAGAGTTSATWAEIDSTQRLEWCQWADDLPTGPIAYANWGSTVAGDIAQMGIGFSNYLTSWAVPTTPSDHIGVAHMVSTSAGDIGVTARLRNPGSLIGGYQFCTLMQRRVAGTGTCSLSGTAYLLLDNNAV